MWNGTKRLLNGDIDIFSLLETFLGMGAGTFGIINILRSIKNSSGMKIFSLGESLKIGFGVMLAIQGFEVMFDGIEKGDVGKTILGAIEGTGGLVVSIKTLLGNTSIKGAIKNLGSLFTNLGKNVKTFATKAISNVSSFGIMTVSSFKNARANGLSFGKSLLQAGKDAGSFLGKVPRNCCWFSRNSRRKCIKLCDNEGFY